SHEAASLAGRLGLGKLIAIYDDNGISIDGKVTEWFADDTAKRFEAYGWHVVRDVDGHDPIMIDAALAAAVADDARPSLVCCKTVIGRGAPTKQGHQDTHGAPLGAEEAARVRAALDWPYAPFEIPATVAEAWDARRQGRAREADWNQRFERYAAAYPELAAEFNRRVRGELPAGFAATTDAFVAAVAAKGETIATRKASQNALAAFAGELPELLGGSADLAHSNLTVHPLSQPITRAAAGNTIFYGVREFGMTAIANGIALHGGFLPYVATFLMFSDYARNAVRMGALMRLRVVHLYTHDSIGLGEDGPTHQPVEHLASLRAMPNMYMWRPADSVETVECWQAALKHEHSPSILALTRQNLPALRKVHVADNLCARGAYEIAPAEGEAAVSIFASGSEVSLAVAAQQILKRKGIAARVVSVPCMDAFFDQPEDYRKSVIGNAKVKVGVEAAVRFGWDAIIGDGPFIGMTGFGESGPYKAVYQFFHITPDAVADAAAARLKS
ncbi:MAG: transketolase family protein, partial [Roseiarcus sp.]